MNHVSTPPTSITRPTRPADPPTKIPLANWPAVFTPTVQLWSDFCHLCGKRSAPLICFHLPEDSEHRLTAKSRGYCRFCKGCVADWLQLLDQSASGYRVPLRCGQGQGQSTREFQVDASGVVFNHRKAGSLEETEIETATELLRSLKPEIIKTPSVGSYSLKHRIEEATGIYLTNGSMIMACHRLGIPQCFEGSLNTGIAVSRRWYKSIGNSTTN